MILFTVFLVAIGLVDGLPINEQSDHLNPDVVLSMISEDGSLDIFEINEDIKGLIEGDILPKLGRNTLTDENKFWPSATVPIELSQSLNAKARSAIDLAIQEFKLRTCINIVTRTVETNYILVDALNGCFSSVGVTGGMQTLSLGTNCETLGITIHEFLHAIGIYHEQSRADRDNYVTILSEYIKSDKLHNFDKKTWSTTSARREPYDYFSIMHYSNTAFSLNDNFTIQTKNPAFQSVIGQRSTLSKSDSNKINRMYQCGDVLLYSYNCNFQDDSVCGYVKGDGDDRNWLRYEISTTTVTTPASPPTSDATFGVTNKGSYVLLDTTGASTGQTGQLRSMRYLSKSTTQCLQFYFYLDKSLTSNTSLTVHVAQIDSESGNITSLGDPVLTFDEDFEDIWQFTQRTLSAPSAYKLVFTGNTGSDINDVIAIDDVSVVDKPCDTGFMVYHNFSHLLQNSVAGSSSRSHVMYTEDGYAYKVFLYPAGVVNAEKSGYVGLYIGLVEGRNDSILTWPFSDRQIRLTIVDQNKNPLHAMNLYKTLETTTSITFQQPIPSSIRLSGYQSFAKLSDLQDTNNYLKGDRLIVSVLVINNNDTTGSTQTSSTVTIGQTSTNTVSTSAETTMVIDTTATIKPTTVTTEDITTHETASSPSSTTTATQHSIENNTVTDLTTRDDISVETAATEQENNTTTPTTTSTNIIITTTSKTTTSAESEATVPTTSAESEATVPTTSAESEATVTTTSAESEAVTTVSTTTTTTGENKGFNLKPEKIFLSLCLLILKIFFA